MQTAQFLKANNQILVTKADKGNATVLLNRSDYTRKALNQVLPPLTPSKGKLTGKLNQIEEKLKDELTSYNSVAPRFYGLPKVHKKECPLRPVVSCIKAPTYNLSKFLGRILSFSTNEEINVRNSYNLMLILKDLLYSLIMMKFSSQWMPFLCLPASLCN